MTYDVRWSDFFYFLKKYEIKMNCVVMITITTLILLLLYTSFFIFKNPTSDPTGPIAHVGCFCFFFFPFRARLTTIRNGESLRIFYACVDFSCLAQSLFQEERHCKSVKSNITAFLPLPRMLEIHGFRERRNYSISCSKNANLKVRWFCFENLLIRSHNQYSNR